MFGKFEPCAFEKWARFDSWPLQQAAFILMGYEPPPLDDLFLPVDWFGDLRTEKSWYWALHGNHDFIKRVFTRFQPWERVQELRDIARALDLAVKNQTIPSRHFVEQSLCVDHVAPTDLMQWARGKGYPILPELDALFPTTPFIEPPLDPDIPPRTKGTLYELIAAMCLSFYGSFPSLEELQSEIKTKCPKEFDPEFLKETLDKAAKKLPNLQ